VPGKDNPGHAHDRAHAEAHVGLQELEELARFLGYYFRSVRMVNGVASYVLQPDEAAQK
jgi:hypothetical protein